MSALAQGLSDVYLQQNIVQSSLQYPPRKGPRREGANAFDIAQVRVLFEQDHERIARDIEGLKASYVFADESVSRFLADHRAFPGILHDAIRPLKASFGADKVFRAEVSTDEDELKTFYVVVRWDGTSDEAAAAIDRFDDQWWLEHMTPAVSNLSFTYDLA